MHDQHGWLGFATVIAAVGAIAWPALADEVIGGPQKDFSFATSNLPGNPQPIPFTMYGFDDGDGDGLNDDGNTTITVLPGAGPFPPAFVTTNSIGLGYDIDDDGNVATGTATVQGAGAMWDAQGHVLGVGLGGIGQLSILEGGLVNANVWLGGYFEAFAVFGGITVNIAPGQGTLTVSGPNSTLNGNLLFYDAYQFSAGTGPHAQAAFTFEDGAVGNLSTLHITGYEVDPIEIQGLITGEDTQVFAAVIEQAGTLRIEEGAQLTSSRMDVRHYSGAYTDAKVKTIITSAGSLLELTGSSPNDIVLDIQATGHADTELLTILDGGKLVTDGESRIVAVSQAAQVRVSGNGSTWDATGRLIALDELATLIVEDNAQLMAGELLSGGVIQITSGATATATIVALGSDGVLDLNGATVNAGLLHLQEGATLQGAGQINGDVQLVSLAFSLADPQPVLSPGQSAGTLNIDGNLLLDGALVQIELGGVAPAEFDRITVTGQVSAPPSDPEDPFDFYEVTVVFSLLPGFAPQLGDQFTFLTAGSFADLSGLSYDFSALPVNLAYQVDSTPNALTLTVIPEPASVLLLVLGIPSLLRRRRL